MAKQMIKTDLQAKKAVAEALDQWVPVDGAKGLFLRVRSGTGRWAYRYSVTEGDKYVDRILTLGAYPAMGLAEARSKHLEAWAAVERARQGQSVLDPVKERKEQRKAANSKRGENRNAITVAALYEAWGGRPTDPSKPRKDGGKELRRIMEVDVLPVIGKAKAKDVTATEIKQICYAKRDGIPVGDKGTQRKTTFIQKRILSYINQLFDWAIEEEIYGLSINPASGITNKRIGVVNKKRERNLSFAEIAELREKLPASGLLPHYQAAISLYLSTGMRLDELLTAKWGNVNIEDRTLKIADTKNGKDHTIYLSQFSIEQLSILKKYSSDIFLLDGKIEGQPKDKRSFASHIRDRIGDKPKKDHTDQFCGALMLSGGRWTIHDLRRTMATRMQEIGVAPWVIEAALNHAIVKGTGAHYSHYMYEKEGRDAFNKWGDHLSRIWSGDTKTAQVIELSEMKAS